MRRFFLTKATVLATVLTIIFVTSILVPSAYSRSCCGERASCDNSCVNVSLRERTRTIEHVLREFSQHKEWLVLEVFNNHLLPALMLFSEQMTATAIYQTFMIGTLLDAKHQLETQRLFQQLMAEAHKDYQPSEGMCTFGTITRSLAASERTAELSTAALVGRHQQRELLSGRTLSGGGPASDFNSRIKKYIDTYCTRADNGTGLSNLCPTSPSPGRINRDINYTELVDMPLTINADFKNTTATPDEEDLFALSANLYAHRVAPIIPMSLMTDSDGKVNEPVVNHYMNIRALAAKRSVAVNSFASIAGMKAEGETEVAPYIFSLMQEFGVAPEHIAEMVGEKPSYHAQMEVLTKKLYQNPAFYTQLYDKPANVARKTASMQAISLMQRRDIYRSILRSEAILSVMLETALMEQQDKISNEINRLDDSEGLIQLPD